MNINLDLIKTFSVVEKYQNITKASEILITTQPAVSKAIKNLEKQLNCNLFIRSKKGVKLTEDGLKLYEASKKVLSIMNGTIKEISETKTINLVVGKILTEKVVLPYVSLFIDKYPYIKINFSETSIEGVKEKLRNREADAAVGYYIDNLSDDYEQIIIKKKLHPIFVCNSKYKKLLNKRISIKEIENYPYIISAKGATTHEYTKDLFKKHNLNITPSMEVLGTSLITNFVKEGLGISILTKEFIKEELNNKELFEIKVKEELESRNLSIIYHKNNNLPKEVQYFINILSNINIEEN